MAAFGGNESCPNCGAQMAADQRYCLNCGHRRGEPRLPFMDAVVFMESISAPGGGGGGTLPPPPPTQSGGSNRWNANAALIAGVATLVLAIGVGFLIGHENQSSPQAAAAPQVIRVEGGGGGGEAAETPATEESATPGGTESKSKTPGSTKSPGKAAAKKPATQIKEGSKEEEERAAAKTAEVLHSTGPEAKTGAQVGEKCVKGTPGCSDGEEFTGNFFGE
jgi:zinc-ribbon domain